MLDLYENGTYDRREICWPTIFINYILKWNTLKSMRTMLSIFSSINTFNIRKGIDKVVPIMLMGTQYGAKVYVNPVIIVKYFLPQTWNHNSCVQIATCYGRIVNRGEISVQVLSQTHNHHWLIPILFPPGDISWAPAPHQMKSHCNTPSQEPLRQRDPGRYQDDQTVESSYE